jgi:hypothetical protein
LRSRLWRQIGIGGYGGKLRSWRRLGRRRKGLRPGAVNSKPVEQQSQQHSSCDADSPSIPEIHFLFPEIEMDVLWLLFFMQRWQRMTRSALQTSGKNLKLKCGTP